MISVKGVSKLFGAKRAVDNVSFTLERGEVLGFLGPNGAGKSTTMRMVTGYLPPTKGTISVDGHDIVNTPLAAQRLMGYLPENAPAYSDMSVLNFLNFAAEIRGMRGENKKRAVDRALEMCFLQPVRHQSIDTLSKGYRHRTCFAQSIIHDPDILILDEPTDGLDPNQKHEVRTLIRRMGERKAIIFSTHILEEVDAVCTRAIIIDQGKVVANGTPEELKSKSELAGALTVTLRKATKDAVLQELKALSGVTKVIILEENGQTITARVFNKAQKQEKIAELAEEISSIAQKKNWSLQTLRAEEGRLDEVFRNITISETQQQEKDRSE